MSKYQLFVYGYSLFCIYREKFILYICIGDFVDRGFYSVETLLLLLALKVFTSFIRKRIEMNNSRSVIQIELL